MPLNVLPFPAPHELLDQKARIRYIRDLMGLTRHEMETKHNIKSISIQKWELGKNKITPKNAIKLAQIAQQNGINCFPDWILYGEGEKPTSNPNLQKRKITETNIFENLPEDERLIADIVLFKKHYPSGEIMIVNDDSMFPQFSLGDYVGGLALPLDQLNEHLDHTFIVKTEDGKKRLRRITRKKNEYTLFGTNSYHKGCPIVEHNVTISDVFIVFWHRIKIKA